MDVQMTKDGNVQRVTNVNHKVSLEFDGWREVVDVVKVPSEAHPAKAGQTEPNVGPKSPK